MGGLKIFARKGAGGGGAGWVRQNKGVSRNCGLSYYTEYFLEIPNDAAWKKILMYLSFLC